MQLQRKILGDGRKGSASSHWQGRETATECTHHVASGSGVRPWLPFDIGSVSSASGTSSAPIVDRRVGRFGELPDVNDTAAHEGLRVDGVLQALSYVDLQQLLRIQSGVREGQLTSSFEHMRTESQLAGFPSWPRGIRCCLWERGCLGDAENLSSSLAEVQMQRVTPPSGPD